MPGKPRQPLALVLAKDRKHLTKKEIQERERQEVHPVTDGVVAPSFLTAAQMTEFNRIACQLEKLRILGETDCQTLARYVVAHEDYVRATQDMHAGQKKRPIQANGMTLEEYYASLEHYAQALEILSKRQDRCLRQVNELARDLGLTISSRCRLVVPVKDEPEKKNKFEMFGKVSRDA